MTLEQQQEAERLLRVARSCACKLRVSYLRYEISPRAEYDWLINEIEAIGALLMGMRND